MSAEEQLAAMGDDAFDAIADEREAAFGMRPTTEDKLAVMAHKMTDAELRSMIEEIVGNPKNAGSRARPLSMGETIALAALMAEEARRVRA